MALRPPDHLRLEVFGAIGGPRLLVATDGVMAIAIVPQTRRYERGPADDRALERLTGLPIDPAGLVALLRGGKPCPGQGAPDPDPHDPGGSGARTCRYGDAKVVTTDGEDGWVESIRITLPGDAGAISLVRIEGPAAAPLGDALFAPTPPDGFAEGDLFRGPGRPLLLQEAGAARGEGG